MRMLNRLLVAVGSLGLVAGSLILPSAVPQAMAQTGTNLIPASTSGLETSGSTGLWDAWYGDTIAQSAAKAFAGTGSLAVTATEANDVGVNWSDYPGVTGVQASTPYTLSYAVNGPAGTTFTMQYEWFNSSQTSLRTDSLSATTNGGWVNPSETVTTPAGATTLFVELTSTNATNGTTYYLDSIDATQGSGGGSGDTVTVTSPGSQTGTVGTAASLQVQATDSASGQTLSYTATGLPPGLSISSTGLISGKPTAAGSYPVTATATDGTGASGSASFTWTIGSGGSGGNCTSPVWTDTAANTDNTDTYSGDSPYVLAMDMWNATASPVSQTMDVCNQGSWSVDDTTTSSTNTAVLVYPNVQENYSSAVSSYSAISSSYAANSTSAGDYEFAYDIWLNGYSTGHNEVMIWTQNHGQTPGGSLVASDITVSGLTWDLYASSDNSYIAFVPANGAAYSSGTLNLLAMFDYLMQNGNIASTSTLTQIDYGVEVCNTGGAEGQFNITGFSISTSS
jgi:Putative Ig domain